VARYEWRCTFREGEEHCNAHSRTTFRSAKAAALSGSEHERRIGHKVKIVDIEEGNNVPHPR